MFYYILYFLSVCISYQLTYIYILSDNSRGQYLFPFSCDSLLSIMLCFPMKCWLMSIYSIVSIPALDWCHQWQFLRIFAQLIDCSLHDLHLHLCLFLHQLHLHPSRWQDIRHICLPWFASVLLEHIVLFYVNDLMYSKIIIRHFSWYLIRPNL